MEGSMKEIAIAWYTKEEWGKVKECAADPEVFDDAWEDWLRKAQQTERKILRKRALVVRVPVTAAALQAWCWKEGLQNSGGNRAAYALHRMERMQQG